MEREREQVALKFLLPLLLLLLLLLLGILLLLPFLLLLLLLLLCFLDFSFSGGFGTRLNAALIDAAESPLLIDLI